MGVVDETMTKAGGSCRLGQQIPPWRCALRRNDKGVCETRRIRRLRDDEGLAVGWVPPCFASAGRGMRPSAHGPSPSPLTG